MLNSFVNLHIKSEVDNVTILNNVVFSFEPDFTGSLEVFFAAKLFQAIDAEGLSSDKTSLDVGMHLAGGIQRDSALLDRPGAYLI